MNRRTFLYAGSTTLGAGLLWCVAGCSPNDFESPSTLALIWEPNTITEIGKKYRAAFPDEDSRETLTTLLSTLKGNDVDASVKMDFVSGRTVQVEGWIISLTEARQCALASMPS